MMMSPQTRLVAAARSFVRRTCLDAFADSEMCDSAVLLTSEVVTNAILHGRGGIRIDVVADAVGVRVDIEDRGPGRPVVRPLDPDAVHGRGMVIVAAAASTWGIERSFGAKTVWFQLGAA
jgi:anti-sigma regulatory factor (Ser/Thr protein kinase)